MKKEDLIEEYSKLLTGIITSIPYTTGRKNKFPLEIYLKYIFRVVFYGERWNTLDCINIEKSTVRKKFYRWNKLGVFQYAYLIMMKEYSKNRIFTQLFIDSTIIVNENSTFDLLDHYYKIKTKNQCKISIICDNNRVTLSYIVSNPKQHDSTFIKPLIHNLNVHLTKNAYLIGDKGYISKRKVIYHNKSKIHIIIPTKKNAIHKTYRDKFRKKLLKKRYIVEQTFSHLKRTYRRLNILEDKKLENYITIINIAITCQIIRALHKQTS